MASPGKIPPVTKLEIKGLFSNPSTFGGNVPTGALKIADNVVIDRPSVVGTRRGRDNQFGTITGTTKSMFQFGAVKLAWTDYLEGTLWCDTLGNGVWNPYTGVYKRPSPVQDGNRVRGLEQNKNFYFNTSNGLVRLDGPSGTPRRAGAPPGLQGTGATTGVTGFMPNNTNVAYRVVFGYKDANNTIVLGAPSSRIIVSNTSGTNANVNVTFQVPKEIQAAPTDWFFQLYRGHTTATLADEPDDNMALCFEDVCTGTPTITTLDLTDNDQLGAKLYTNADEEGIVQSNYRPPFCVDMCLFEGVAFYANTRDLQTQLLTLLASGALAGADALVPGDNIDFTPNGAGTPFTLTAAVANNAALGQFAVSNTGNPGVDLYQTAYNICLIANSYSGNTFLTAYYISGYNDRPGQMKFDRIDLTEDTFTISCSRTTCWVEALPVTSSNTARVNRIYFSKENQPEAVPLTNYFEIGSANQRIDRILTLQNGFIALKQDGVFRVAAGDPYITQLLDSTARILAPNTAVVGDNRVWFFSDQGVVAATETDVQIQSFILDNIMIRNGSGALFPNLQEVAWAIAYQPDRKYELWLPSTGIETQATQQYIFNYLVKEWTRWTFKGTSAMYFNVDDKIYYGSESGSAPGVNQSYTYKERKSITPSDFVDDEYRTTCVTVGNTDTITVNNFVLPTGMVILPGWTITQTATGSLARVVSVTIGMTTTVIELDRLQNWNATTLSAWQPVYDEIETIQIDCNNPGFNKQFVEAVYMFTEQTFEQVTLGISSDTTSAKTIDYLVPLQTGGWGVGPWGSTPWGGTTPAQGKIRRYVPQDIQRAGWIFINLKSAEAFNGFGFSGFEMYFNVTSTRQF